MLKAKTISLSHSSTEQFPYKSLRSPFLHSLNLISLFSFVLLLLLNLFLLP